ncbi:hypothetical protein Tco_0337445 [Tanacetum coccineum]
MEDSPCPRKNTKNLNNKVIKLNEELSDCETDLYNYKRGLSQVEARLVEFKNSEIKFCERIGVLERDLELRDNKLKISRMNLKRTQRSVKDKTGLGFNEYTAVPPSPAQVYSPPKMICLGQKAIWKSNSVSFSEQGGSIGNDVSKPMIRFVKEISCPSVSKVNNTAKSRKPTVKYAEMYRKPAMYVEVLNTCCKHKRHVNDQKQVKPVWNNSKRVNHHYSTRITHPNPKRNMIPQAILMRSGRKTINAAKPKAVHNAVKASTCWVWKPKNRVIDHVSKYNNASITLKRFDYIDAQGRFKSVMAWMDAQTQGRHEHDQEFDAEITTVGAEVDDIAAET